MNKIIPLISFAVTTILASSGMADQLTLGPSTHGQYIATGVPPGMLILGSPGLSGTAYYGNDVGTYTFMIMSPKQFGPVADGSYSLPPLIQSLQVQLSDGSKLVDVIDWMTLKDGSWFPNLIGELSPALVTGQFANFTNASVDLTLKFILDAPFTLEELTQTIGTELLEISSGEILPHPASEPASLLLFGTMIFGLIGGISLRGRREPRLVAPPRAQPESPEPPSLALGSAR